MVVFDYVKKIYCLPDLIIRKTIQLYETAATDGQATTVLSFPLIARGSETQLPEENDNKVIDVIRNMQTSDAVFNYVISSSTAKHMVLARN